MTVGYSKYIKIIFQAKSPNTYLEVIYSRKVKG